MHHHNQRTIIDSAVFTVKVFADEEVKTTSEPRYSSDKNEKKYFKNISTVTLVHYLTLSTIGLLSWGLLWCAFGDGWRWDGRWFTLVAVASVAWASGRALEAGTTLPPLLAALLTGILARNLNILDMRQYTQMDAFLRKIYPVVILGKASLGWDLSYMKDNWQQISLLGVVPWCGEVAAVATCSHFLADFPWIWGFLLGSVYASVSCAVVIPTVQRVSKNVGPTGTHVNWSQLVCTAGGVDTALSVGVFGLIFSLMFCDTNDVYRYVKAGLTLFVGVGAGVAWGRLAGMVPHSHDHYHQELRVLFVLFGGLFANFFTSLYEWGGTGGVAVLACNATAAMYWARRGWQLNNNPASTAYRVMWSALEPVLFAYTGTFFVIDSSMSDSVIVGLEILVICLSVRLALAFLVCWKLTIKERLFVCCVWIPKSIVEAVLCPLALDTLLHGTNSADGELKHSEQLMRFIIQAILITTPIGFLLTKCLGPILLRETIMDCSEDAAAVKRSSQNEIDGRSTLF